MRMTSLFALTAAFALSASVATACPYMNKQQVTQAPQAPMSPIAGTDAPSQSVIATNDIVTLPTTGTTSK